MPVEEEKVKANEIDHPRSQSGIQDVYSRNKGIENFYQNSIKDDQNTNFSTIGSNQNYYEENKNKTSKIAYSSTDLNKTVSIL